MLVVGDSISAVWDWVAEVGKDSEHHQKPSCEHVLDRRVAADEMAESVGPVVVFVVNIVLAVEIVAAVNEKAGVAEHLRQILVADEHRQG
jgi:hypothetical protein